MVVKVLTISRELAEVIADRLRYRHEGNTVLAVIQDYESREVLMVGHMSREALIKTLTTGYLHLYSLSRGKLWLKGESSSNYQVVEDVSIDCDYDAVLVMVKSLGPICHTGSRTCFFRKLSELTGSAKGFSSDVGSYG